MRRQLARGLIALALTGCGGMRDTVQSAGAPLRLSRVVLYENGLAHFERRGRADEGTVDLRVPASQVDDVLRSLTVVDGADAAITGVRLLPAAAGDDVTLRVGLASEGARDLSISYVTELPGWRPTYRLVVQGDRRVHVQGLAVIDNPTSEAWQDVALTLSTEVPLSFRFDLRTARTTHRPLFGPDGHLVREVIAPGLALLNVASTGGSEINEAYGLAQRDQPEMSNRAGRMVDPSGASPPGSSLPGSSSASPATSAMLAFEQRPEEDGGIFSSVEGFDLGAAESGLVPFVDTATAGEIALVFKPSPGGDLSQSHPYRAVLFQNPSDASLLTGPVAIYAGDRFVGDGVTGAIPAHAHAFVPFAIERSVRVDRSVEDAEDEVRAVALAGGVLTVDVRAVHRERFTITATSAIDAPVFAFASTMPGFEPRELPPGTIATGAGWFLPLSVESGAVVLDLVRRSRTTVNIASSPDHVYVPALLAMLPPGDDVERLRAIADRLVTLSDDLARVEEDLGFEQRALGERRSALEALRSVSSGGTIRQQLAHSVADGVGRVDALTQRATELHAEQIALGQEWYARLRATTRAR